jgi:hypothetical protein
VGGIDDDRRQDRKETIFEIRDEFRFVFPKQIGNRADMQSRRRQFRAQFAVPQFVLIRVERPGLVADAPQLLVRRQRVGARIFDVAEHGLVQSAHADFKELVEVVRGDREELQAFEKGIRRIAGFVEHATVEVDPGEFPVDVRVGGIAGVGHAGAAGRRTVRTPKGRLGRHRGPFGACGGRWTPPRRGGPIADPSDPFRPKRSRRRNGINGTTRPFRNAPKLPSA